MSRNEINIIFSQIHTYTLQAINEDGISISNINGINLFCYYLEEDAKLFLYAHIGRVYAQDTETQNNYYKKLLQMNLPLFSKHNICLGVSENEMIYLTTKLDRKLFFKEEIENQIQLFLQEVHHYQETIQNIFLKSKIIPQTKSLHKSFDMTMLGIMRV